MIHAGAFIKQATSARALGIEWSRNVPQHSFISRRIAKVKSADQVALETGNPASIILKHHQEPTTPEVAEKGFAIPPKEGRWDNTFTMIARNTG